MVVLCRGPIINFYIVEKILRKFKFNFSKKNLRFESLIQDKKKRLKSSKKKTKIKPSKPAESITNDMILR